MKKRTVRRTSAVCHPAYPNQAAPGYFSHKVLDIVTAVLSSAGLLMAFLFLFMLA